MTSLGRAGVFSDVSRSAGPEACLPRPPLGCCYCSIHNKSHVAHGHTTLLVWELLEDSRVLLSASHKAVNCLWPISADLRYVWRQPAALCFSSIFHTNQSSLCATMFLPHKINVSRLCNASGVTDEHKHTNTCLQTLPLTTLLYLTRWFIHQIK